MMVRSLGGEDPLGVGTATHCSILTRRIPWTEEPGRLQPIGLDTTQMTSLAHAALTWAASSAADCSGPTGFRASQVAQG